MFHLNSNFGSDLILIADYSVMVAVTWSPHSFPINHWWTFCTIFIFEHNFIANWNENELCCHNKRCVDQFTLVLLALSSISFGQWKRLKCSVNSLPNALIHYFGFEIQSIFDCWQEILRNFFLSFLFCFGCAWCNCCFPHLASIYRFCVIATHMTDASNEKPYR